MNMAEQLILWMNEASLDIFPRVTWLDLEVECFPYLRNSHIDFHSNYIKFAVPPEMEEAYFNKMIPCCSQHIPYFVSSYFPNCMYYSSTPPKPLSLSSNPCHSLPALVLHMLVFTVSYIYRLIVYYYYHKGVGQS